MCMPSPAGQTYSNQNGAAGGMKARALFDFTSDCEEELSLKVSHFVFSSMTKMFTSHTFNDLNRLSLCRLGILLLIWSL